MLSIIQKKHGHNFIRNSESLINDVENSIKINDDFYSSSYANNNEFRSNFTIISHNNMSRSHIDITLHDDIQSQINAFQNFYYKNFNMRKLNWSYYDSAGICEITFPGGKKEFTASLIQLNVLSFINIHNKLSIKDLLIKTNINENIFASHINNLFLSNVVNILKKEGEGENALISFNKDYTSKIRKISLLSLITKRFIK